MIDHVVKVGGGDASVSGKYSHAYRPDIDGLRAVAVLVVLLFHCFPSLVPGGFVGVDVFFVISGYLIGRSSFAEMAAGGYSAWAYFGRRARRIFPALLVVLISVLIAGWWVLLPVEYELLGKHIAGASVFISNWQFWREVGYFNTEATLKPLLHLWSLAVEEQFYLILPLLLLAGGGKRRWLPWVLIGLAVVSMVSVSLRLADHKAWAYFHLVSRCWELLVGVLLAYFQSCIKVQVVGIRRWEGPIGGLGLVLVLGSAWGYSANTSFPGPAALLPTLGAAMVIAAGAASPINRLLALRPLVYIGLISYPLYLWHWPMLALLRIVDGGLLDNESRLLVLILSFPLASLTYHWVERPLRFSALAQFRFFPLLLWVCLLIVGVTGYQIYMQQGMVERRPSWDTTLQPASAEQVLPPPGFTSSQKAILLGDSHALMYSTALRSYFFKSHGKELIYGFRAGCKPFYNLDKHTPGHSPQGCPRAVNPAIDKAISDPTIDTIVVASALVSFNYYIYPGFDQASPDLVLNDALMSQAADDTFAMLAGSGKRIIVFLTTPMLGFQPVDCQQRPYRWRSEPRAECTITATLYEQQQRWSREKLAQLATRHPNIRVFDPATVLCTSGSCQARVEGKLIYADGAHLNAYGAELVARGFDF